MTIQIKVLRRGDEAVLAKVAPEVFDNPVDPDLTREFLADPRHHIAVAIDDGFVVGFASAVHYVHPDKRPELWINEVAVAPTHHQRGLAKAVMNALFAEGRACHCVNAWVLTSAGNPPALALYSGLGGVTGAPGMGDDIVGFEFPLTD